MVSESFSLEDKLKSLSGNTSSRGILSGEVGEVVDVVDVKSCFETFGEAALVLFEFVVEVVSELTVNNAISVVLLANCDVPADSAKAEDISHVLAEETVEPSVAVISVEPVPPVEVVEAPVVTVEPVPDVPVPVPLVPDVVVS